MQTINADSARLIEAEQSLFDLASIVKELLDNSIDAKATKIQITFRDFGMKSLSVSDNGHGIDHQVLDFALRPHTTSKIQDFTCVTDAIPKYLGFRVSLSSFSKLHAREKLWRP